MPVAHRRVALVTGSSRGLGAVIARRLARDGLAVAVNGGRGDGPAREVAGSICDGGGIVEAFGAGVTDEAQVAELIAAITGRFGPIDVLVLNATGPQAEAPVTEVAWASHLAQLDFFVMSPVLLGRAVLPGMQARRYGRIVHIDSEVADRPPPGSSAYPTAKSAQIGLARSWARELAPSGITVNTVAPGFVPVERRCQLLPCRCSGCLGPGLAMTVGVSTCSARGACPELSLRHCHMGPGRGLKNQDCGDRWLSA